MEESIKYSIRYLLTFVNYNLKRTVLHSENDVKELIFHLQVARKELIEKRFGIMEQLFECLNPNELVSGQSNVPGFNDLERLVQEIFDEFRLLCLKV